jgi:membrane protein insertase Oxa1/YidC/SpoIIIJ
MGVFLYNYAAGLSLYMITQSIFGILETTVDQEDLADRRHAVGQAGPDGAADGARGGGAEGRQLLGLGQGQERQEEVLMGERCARA